MAGWISADGYFIVFVVVVHANRVSSSVNPCEGATAVLRADTTPKYLLSPNYPHGYDNNERCVWRIEALYSYEVVRFEVLEMFIRSTSTSCADDYLDVRDGASRYASSLRKLCGSKPTAVVTSNSPAIHVTFISDAKDSDIGFRMKYWAVAKGEVVYAPVVMGTANYALFGVFGVIVSSMILQMVTIAVIRQCKKNAAKIQATQKYENETPAIVHAPSKPIEKLPPDPVAGRLFSHKNSRSTMARDLFSSRSSLLINSTTTLTSPL